MSADGSDSDREHLRQEVARLQAEAATAREQADQWRRVAEERRVTLERWRQHPAIRVGVGATRYARPLLASVRRVADRTATARANTRRLLTGARRVPAQFGARARARALRRACRRLTSPARDSRTVSVVVLTRDGEDNLRRLLPHLTAERTGADVEVLVVDNGSGPGVARLLADWPMVGVVRSDYNRSFSAANELGASRATGDVLCFLNDDVEPVVDGWLARLLRELEGDVVAVGAQLVYPWRGWLAPAPAYTVQHCGIRFDPVSGGMPQAHNIGGGPAEVVERGEDVPAVTAAVLLTARATYVEVGGFDDRYVYGAEDVDLCWRLGRLGRIRVALDAVLFHYEGTTRHRVVDARERDARQQRNWGELAGRFGPAIRRAVELDRLTGQLELASQPYTVAITITRDHPDAAYGDLYTARELGTALEHLGWRVRYVERYRDAYYDLPADVDALVVLLDTCDIRRVARPGLTTIAWVRNWGERWLTHPWFDEFDVVLASSGRMAERIAASSRHRPVVFPLATNPDRFVPGGGRRHGVVLALNHFGDDRGAVDLAATVADLELYGKGWDAVPEVVDRWHGHLPYEELPALYGRAEVVLDRAGHHTKQDASVNARVFDALAAGALVVTDQHDGAEELFGGLLPSADLESVGDLIAQLRADPETPERKHRLREVVVAHHSYTHRAHTLQRLLLDRVRRPAVDFWIGAPDLRAAQRWGDLHLAEAFARELRVRGCHSTVRAQDGWQDRAARTADVVVQLKGRGTSIPTEGSLHILWVISHPDEVTEEECDRADLVLVASERFAAELRHRTSSRVEVLLQATDERRFSPRPRSERYRHELAFVGNSKFSHRPAVDAAVAAGLDLAIYGDNWDGYAPARLVHARHVRNEELPELYSSITLLLNDHWEDMQRWGFVSNRCYDALACGAVMVSDRMEELDAQLDGAVATFDGSDDLAAVVRDLLSQPEERMRRADRGRAAVLARHTFAHRADELLRLLEPELRARGLQVGDPAPVETSPAADRPVGQP